jgi:malate permease and related proteins
MGLDGLLDAVPILMLIALGVVLRQVGLLDARGGLALTRLAFNVTIPAAIFVSIARASFELTLLWMPVLGFLVPILLAGLMYLTTRRLADRPRQRGPLLVGMVVLGVFAFPFMDLFFGPGGLARIALYDVGNAFYSGIVAVTLARRFGRDGGSSSAISWRRVFASPILAAAIAGVVFTMAEIPLAGPFGAFCDRLAAANTPLAMIAVGVFLRPQRAYGALVAQFILIRMLVGGLLGWGLALLLGLDGLSLIAATVGSSLPAGTTVLVLSGNEGLDAELAASLVSVSILVGAIVVSLLPHLLAAVYL